MSETTTIEDPRPRTASAVAELAGRRAALKDAEPKLRARDAAERLGVSEAELVASGCPSGTAVLLDAGIGRLIERLPELGEVMALTRNDHAVHEKVGRYGNITIQPHAGLVLNHDIDLRLFLKHWRFCLAVREPAADGGIRRSLQFFDPAGSAVHKVFLRPESDAAAFDRLVDEHTSGDQSGLLQTRPPKARAADRADADIDVAALRTEWRALKDTHDFYGMLRRLKIGRLQALRLAGEDLAHPVSAGSLRFALERAAERALPIMVFVGNDGCVQIHSGPVARTVAMGPWLNVLDPGFNLHVREDRIAHAWVVRKPTVDGIVTALEIYGSDGRIVLSLFGVRKPGTVEDEGWRRLADELPRLDLEAVL